MKVVLAQDWITDNGGGESCLRALLDIYPQSPILTLIWNEKKVKQFNDTKIITSFLNNYPQAKTKWRYYFSLMPRAVESLSIPKCEVVISNCYSAIKGLIVKPETLSILYCHTPTRYLWLPEIDERLSQGNLIKRMLAAKMTDNLRFWDFAAAQRPDIIVANSQNAKNRIKKFYRREAAVIYPPVDIHKFEAAGPNQIGDYFLFVSRLIPYKKADLVVSAFNRLGLPLKIAGDGPERQGLKKMAKSNVEILGYVNEKKLRELLSHCRAFIFPAEEDFGIAPVEAMASGRPVIALGRGGALETVVEGETGLFFQKQTVGSLISAIKRFAKFEKTFNPQKAIKRAKKFSVERYKREWQEFVKKSLLEYRESDRI
ncbi:MAG: glycosyl transferase group 1 [Candidatus Berkelbacteria bacterium Licking1014_96]|uniref:Glycosyl transferase group 1 n=1 Tax=Candidatus Berkelbacteria bacterium Licking1014_96 TaxID=2017149 RepID=A0A554LF33_9BACT|nr:MAG: glycosyl transferase group 1 [Candidatus Berkelbacteria bacterium Licking1014_96]